MWQIISLLCIWYSFTYWLVWPWWLGMFFFFFLFVFILVCPKPLHVKARLNMKQTASYDMLGESLLPFCMARLKGQGKSLPSQRRERHNSAQFENRSWNAFILLHLFVHTNFSLPHTMVNLCEVRVLVGVSVSEKCRNSGILHMPHWFPLLFYNFEWMTASYKWHIWRGRTQ